MYYYESVRDDRAVEEKLLEYAKGKLANRGCPEYYKRIRREGIKWNHKRVERIYRKLGMNHKKKHKRRIPNPLKTPLIQPEGMNLTWSMDFMEDRMENGRKIRVLNIIDDFNREVISMEVNYSFPSNQVVEAVKQAIEWRGKPRKIRTDNGTEFIANAFEQYCLNNKIDHVRIRKGKPAQNSYVERFNRSYREAVLDAFIFESLNQVRQETESWMEDYNHHHPHESLGDKTPIEYLNENKIGESVFSNSRETD
jgi:putative transposase